jgi:hypothetical protein
MKRFLILLLALSATSIVAAESRQLPVVDPVTKMLTVNGKTPDQMDRLRPETAESNSVSHTIWTYDPWTCEAGNWDTCDGHMTFDSPAGFQICRVTKTESNMSGRDRYSSFDSTGYYPNDPESPDRFRSAELYVHAAGNHSPIGDGSSITVVFVVDTIPASADNYTRYFENCQLPLHG